MLVPGARSCRFVALRSLRPQSRATVCHRCASRARWSPMRTLEWIHKRSRALRHGIPIAAFALLLVCVTARDAGADEVVLTNGDRLSGTIVSGSPGSLVLENQLLGTMTIPWSALARASSVDAVHVTLTNGETAEGRLNVTQGRISLARVDSTTVPMTAASIRALAPAAAPIPSASWHGAVSAAIDVSRGNTETRTFATSGNAMRVGGRDRLGLFGTSLFSSVGASDSAVTTARATRAGARYDHDVISRMF